ncbi:MAG TPA: protein kinase, partial [Ktedonobacterales bacterium]|nr:protein kinase [Ktedonobacterales bacterium]
GTLLFNRYLIQGYISGGGFGHIYKALDITFGYRRALKEAFYQDPNTRRQFHLEAEFLLNTRHPHLVRAYLVFEQMGHLYLVMDYVDGHTLEEIAIDHIRRTGWTLPEARILEWVIPICGALHALHSSPVPIIHRDVKPANVKVTRQGIPILIDLGLAKLFAPGTQTIGAALAFTPGYAPPEQYRASGATDARTDVYGMGASLFYLLTGYQPTEAPARLGAQAIPQLRQLNPAVSRLTEMAVMRAMELDPAQRQQSALALEQDLRAALAALQSQPRSGELPASDQAAAQICLRCGAGNPAEARHCMRCGSALDAGPAWEQPAHDRDVRAATAGAPADGAASGAREATPEATPDDAHGATSLPDWLMTTLRQQSGTEGPALPGSLADERGDADPAAPAVHAPAGAIPIPPHISARPLFAEADHGAGAAAAAGAATAAGVDRSPALTPSATNETAATPLAPAAYSRPDAPLPPPAGAPLPARRPPGARRLAGQAAFLSHRPEPWRYALPSLRRWHVETLSAAPPLNESEARSALAAVLALVLACATLLAAQPGWWARLALLAGLPALALAHWCLASRQDPPVPEARWIATLALIVSYTWLALYTIGTLVMLFGFRH